MGFKQLLQLEAIDVCQIDSCRIGGVSEILGVLLMSAKFGVPVCPHAGGVGLCEYVVSTGPTSLRSESYADPPCRSTCLLSITSRYRVTWTGTFWNSSSKPR